MNKTYFTLLLLAVFSFASAQIINIPDANFKNALLNRPCTDLDGDGTFEDADANNDGEIDISEAEAITILRINHENISDLTGIENFTNIEELFMSNNQISIMDLTNLVNLRKLYAQKSELNTLDVSTLTQLEELFIPENNITSIDLTNNTILYDLVINENELTNLDVSQNFQLSRLLCNFNSLTQLNVTNCVNLVELNCEDNSITQIDVSSCTNLQGLVCNFNNISNLDVTANANLEGLQIMGNPINEVDLTQNLNLRSFFCANTGITSFDASYHENLGVLMLNNCNIQDLDLSYNPSLNWLFANNLDLQTLNLKNGFSQSINIELEGNPNLSYVCIDDYGLERIRVVNELNQNNYNSTALNSYCTFDPAGEFYEIQGSAIVDYNNNGCDVGDPKYPSVRFQVSNDDTIGSAYTNAQGDYYLPVQSGSHTITPSFEGVEYFNVSPESITVDFPDDASPVHQDFCFMPNGTKNDLEVVVLPVTPAIPGFDGDYKVLIKNKGNTVLNGNLTLVFDDDFMNFVSASTSVDSQSEGSLVWNFANLLPLQCSVINVTFNLNTPTDPNFPLNGGEILIFEATIDPISDDETPIDNVFELNQAVVNSFDPNDKTCLQGESIMEAEVGEFVHYLIRFENIGTANATNVVIKDIIDTDLFDMSSLVPLIASHNYVTRTRETNIVEFIFENIDLPFDDANNDGFVIFKIRTVNTLQLDDTFDNDAEIYFDFNYPIETNNFITTIDNNLGLSEATLQTTLVYPNPVEDILNLEVNGVIKSVFIYDIQGKLLSKMISTANATSKQLDVSHLSQGVYFFKVETDHGAETFKVIKE